MAIGRYDDRVHEGSSATSESRTLAPRDASDLETEALEQEEAAAAEESAVLFEREDDALLIRLAGTWSLDLGLPSVENLQRELETPPPPRRNNPSSCKATRR